jgi:hypothetical protein
LGLGIDCRVKNVGSRVRASDLRCKTYIMTSGVHDATVNRFPLSAPICVLCPRPSSLRLPAPYLPPPPELRRFPPFSPLTPLTPPFLSSRREGYYRPRYCPPSFPLRRFLPLGQGWLHPQTQTPNTQPRSRGVRQEVGPVGVKREASSNVQRVFSFFASQTLHNRIFLKKNPAM